MRVGIWVCHGVPSVFVGSEAMITFFYEIRLHLATKRRSSRKLDPNGPYPCIPYVNIREHLQIYSPVEPAVPHQINRLK